MCLCDETTFPNWNVKYLIFDILKIQNLVTEKISLLVDKDQNLQDLQVFFHIGPSCLSLQGCTSDHSSIV